MKLDNELTIDDYKNIKSLIAYLNAVVDFLHSRNGIADDIVNEFKSNQHVLSRILKIKGLAVYFKRYITTRELKALLKIILLGPEIIRIGAQKEHFLCAEEQQTLHLHRLIQEITRNYTRWIVR